MSQCGQPLGDGPEPIEAQRVHGQAPERGHDLNAVDLAVTVSVFAELGVARPVPGVLNAPAITHVSQQRLCTGAQTRDVVPGLIDELAIAVALAAHRDHRGASWPVLLHPLGCRHPLERPGDVAAVTALTLSGAQRSLSAVGKAILDHLKPLVPPARWPAAR